MKKILAIALLLLAGLTASAQVPTKWTSTKYAGDELTGTQAYTAYSYTLPGTGKIVTFGWNTPEFRIITEKGIFQESVYYTGFGESKAVKVLVGIYKISSGGPVLLERFNLFMDKERNSLGDKICISSASLKRERKKAMKVLQALTTSNRIVRFICPRFSDTSLDFNVPFYNE